MCEQLVELLLIKPNEIQANNYLKLKQSKLNILLKNSEAFRHRQTDGVQRVKEYCSHLKNKIQTANYMVINQMNVFKKELNDKVDQYELDMIRMFESKPELKDTYVCCLSETDLAIKNLYLTDNDSVDTNTINDLLLKEKVKLDSLVFNEKFLKFDTNKQEQLTSLVLGSLSF